MGAFGLYFPEFLMETWHISLLNFGFRVQGESDGEGGSWEIGWGDVAIPVLTRPPVETDSKWLAGGERFGEVIFGGGFNDIGLIASQILVASGANDPAFISCRRIFRCDEIIATNWPTMIESLPDNASMKIPPKTATVLHDKFPRGRFKYNNASIAISSGSSYKEATTSFFIAVQHDKPFKPSSKENETAADLLLNSIGLANIREINFGQIKEG